MERYFKGIKEGNEKTIAEAITLVENDREQGFKLLKKIFSETEISYIIGITGPPGSGKSTLTGEMVKDWLRTGVKTGIIAVDPTSQFSGGALLGDRIRMSDKVTDKNVFIRSMATRGELGGLNSSVFDTALILSAAGYERIVIETVGVGQNEIDIVNLADTTLVITTPDAGDEIQTFKAGLMETGDIFVVNKADRPDVIKMELMIKQMLEMAYGTETEWTPPVLTTVANRSQGIEELLQKIEEHTGYLKTGRRFYQKRKKVLEKQLINLMERILRENYIGRVLESGLMEEKIREIAARKLDPYTAAENLIKERGV